MADQLLEKVQDLFDGQIDFKGQKLAELLSTALLTLTGVIAFLVGYITQDITLSLWTGLGGTALAFVVVVPPWPFFNTNPLQWAHRQAVPIVVDGKKVS